MIPTPTPEQMAKLPQWTQQFIKNLQRERDTAIKALNEYCDQQTPSAFSSDEPESTGESSGPTIKRRYFQGSSIDVKHAGVTASIYLPRKDDGQRQFGIEIKFEPIKPRSVFEHVAIIPGWWNTIYLVAKENV